MIKTLTKKELKQINANILKGCKALQAPIKEARRA